MSKVYRGIMEAGGSQDKELGGERRRRDGRGLLWGEWRIGIVGRVKRRVGGEGE